MRQYLPVYEKWRVSQIPQTFFLGWKELKSIEVVLILQITGFLKILGTSLIFETRCYL